MYAEVCVEAMNTLKGSCILTNTFVSIAFLKHRSGVRLMYTYHT